MLTAEAPLNPPRELHKKSTRKKQWIGGWVNGMLFFLQIPNLGAQKLSRMEAYSHRGFVGTKHLEQNCQKRLKNYSQMLRS